MAETETEFQRIFEGIRDFGSAPSDTVQSSGREVITLAMWVQIQDHERRHSPAVSSKDGTGHARAVWQ
jgi:hypothetical protein